MKEAIENVIDKSVRFSYPHTTYMELVTIFEDEIEDLLQTPVQEDTLPSLKGKLIKVMGSTETLGLKSMSDSIKEIFSDPMNDQYWNNLKSCKEVTFNEIKSTK